MAWFSNLFKRNTNSPGVVSGRNPGKGWTDFNRYYRKKGGFAGGYGSWTFQNIMNAHGSAEDIVYEFGLDTDYCEYIHPHYGRTPFGQAYAEVYAEAVLEAAMLDCDPWEIIDWDEIEDLAHDYALELAELYIGRETWIPREILHWAYYEVSSHN